MNRDVPLDREFRSGSILELKASIYAAHGWHRKAGESCSARIAAIYEVSIDYSSDVFVARPKRGIEIGKGDAQ